MAKHSDRDSDPSGVEVRTDWHQPSSSGIFTRGHRQPVGNGDSDIHRVVLRNFNSFDGSVECESTLQAHPWIVKFVPLSQNHPGTVADATWTAQQLKVPSALKGGRLTLNHAGFTATGSNHGDQSVEVKVTVTWSSRFAGPPVTLHLSFDVSA